MSKIVYAIFIIAMAAVLFLGCQKAQEKKTDSQAKPEPMAAMETHKTHPDHDHAKPDAKEDDIRASMAKLSEEDRKLAEKQRFCPATEERLGLMGPPVKTLLDGKPVFVCCKGCINDVKKQPKEIQAKLEAYQKGQFPKE